MPHVKTERRKFVRRALPEEAIYVTSRNTDIGGWLKNIGGGGLAFEYHPVSGGKMAPASFVTLSGNRIPFSLSAIPCKLIYDIETIEENLTFKGQEIRLCGLQYGELAEEKRQKLDDFLKAYRST